LPLPERGKSGKIGGKNGKVRGKSGKGGNALTPYPATLGREGAARQDGVPVARDGGVRRLAGMNAGDNP
jgi:hypothetical protein